MRHHNLPRAAALASMVLLAACGDARLDKLALGISKDSAATVIGQVPHREISFLTAGKVWEVQLYSRNNADAKDSIRWRKMSPVVFINQKTVGWGWHWWSAAAKKQGIQMPSN